jgi:lipopolysaccharide assembly outer membrane protein LptD (OstA)
MIPQFLTLFIMIFSARQIFFRYTGYSCLFLSQSFFAFAHQKTPSLIIRVAGRVVYDKNRSLCTAYGNVHAYKGETEISGDQICVYFHKEQADTNQKKDSVPSPSSQKSHIASKPTLLQFSKGKIKKICVIGNATIQHHDTLLKAPSMTYDAQKETISAFGPQIELTNAKTYLLAHNSVVYDQKTCIATAYGQVFIQHQETPQKPLNKMYADQAQAFFFYNNNHTTTQNPEKHTLKLKEVHAQGQVAFQQGQIYATAKTARYEAKSQKACFEGGVKIKENNHFAQGEKAEFDLQKKVYTLSSSTECIFYPQSDKKEKR